MRIIAPAALELLRVLHEMQIGVVPLEYHHHGPPDLKLVALARRASIVRPLEQRAATAQQHKEAPGVIASVAREARAVARAHLRRTDHVMRCWLEVGVRPTSHDPATPRYVALFPASQPSESSMCMAFLTGGSAAYEMIIGGARKKLLVHHWRGEDRVQVRQRGWRRITHGNP